MTDRPNIVLLMTDQQRPDSLGCYGSDAARTPNIDRLAANGVRFDGCYVQNPLCCPSRYSIATGRYPHAHGVRANWYAPRPGERSTAHALGEVGYRSAAIGKTHYTPWYDNFGFDGRIIAESKMHPTVPDDYERFLAAHGRSRSELYDFGGDAYVRDATAVPSAVPQDLHIDTFVGRASCDYIRRVDAPFFLFASFPSPHNPYDPPEPYDRLFDDVDLPARNMTPGEVDRKPREAYEYINRRLGWPVTTDRLSDEVVAKTRRAYYGLNTLVDDWVGRIVDTLDGTGKLENTVIVYMSDHGDLLGDHGLVYKQCFYEQSVRVPFIVHAPGRFEAGVERSLIESIDLHATLCELAGADHGPGNQGRSLVPLLERRPDVDHRDAVFSANYFGRMVRSGPHKLVHYPGRPYGELYDLENDPDEQANLWHEPAAADVRAGLEARLLEWAFASEDPMPLPVRPDHQDHSPRRHLLHDGGTVEAPRQPWHLAGFEDLYERWRLDEPGELR